MRAQASSRWHQYDMLDARALAPSRIGGLWFPVTVLLLVACGAIAYVWFQSTTDSLHRELTELRGANQVLGKEIDNLALDLETYKSARHISRSVQEFDLALRPPYPGQVRRLSLARHVPETPSETADTLLARRWQPGDAAEYRQRLR